MFKKTILFILVCILTLQIFPVQWLAMLVDEGHSIELIAMSDTDEDSDDETSKAKKVKVFESDIVLLNTYEAFTSLLKCTHENTFSTSNHCSEVLCPPPNSI